MSNLQHNYTPPTERSDLRPTKQLASTDMVRELHKIRKTMSRMEKRMQVLCLILLENQRGYQLKSDYGHIFDFDRQDRKRGHRKSISYLDILD